MEDELGKRANTEHQLRVILLRLQSARMDTAVITALEGGMLALRDLLATDLTIERVDSVMEQIDDVLVSQDDVTRTLTAGPSSPAAPPTALPCLNERARAGLFVPSRCRAVERGRGAPEPRARPAPRHAHPRHPDRAHTDRCPAHPSYAILVLVHGG